MQSENTAKGQPQATGGPGKAPGQPQSTEGHVGKLKKPTARAAISNGRKLLATADGRSCWARYYADTYAGLLTHLGGEGYVSEARRMLCRRAATLECELSWFENELATLRQNDERPDPVEVDNYARWASAQRRVLEALGLDRVARDVTSLSSYIREIESQKADKAEAQDVEADT